jgi:GAF domain-containing protein
MRRQDGSPRSAKARAAFLTDASAVLSSTLDYEAVLERIAALAVPRMAEWCGVFSREDGGEINCDAVRHRDASITDKARRYIAAQPIDINAPHGVGKVIRTGEPELVNDVSAEMLHAVARDEAGVRLRLEMGHGSLLIVPLSIRGVVLGALAFGRATIDAYDERDLTIARDLAQRVALALHNARLYREAEAAREKADRAAWQSAFLADASRVLFASLDYDATLDAMIRLAVPTLADWVSAHVALRDGTLRRIGPVYADPRLAPLAEEVRRVAPMLRLTGTTSVTLEVAQTGTPLLLPELSPEWLEHVIQDPGYLKFALRLNPRSLMIVPLVARGRLLGSLTFVSVTETRRYGEADLAFAEELGRRSGLAIDNARLFRQAEQAQSAAEEANRAKDQFLAVLSHELRTPLTSIAGWTRMLEKGTVQGPQAERAFETIGRNVRVLRRLIEDLLDVSAVIAGKLRLERAPVDLGLIVEESVTSNQGEAAAKRVRLKSEADQFEQACGGGVEVGGQLGDLVAETIQLCDRFRGGDNV